MRADRVEELGKRNGVAGAVLARVTPERLIAEADVAGTSASLRSTYA
jgi:hypothetical protein